MCDNKILENHKIGIGWFQQMPPFIGEPTNLTQTLQNESLLTLQSGIWDILEIPWINRPSDVIFASNKIRQLVAANKAGLSVPTTSVSNLPEDIRSFSEGRQVIAKNLATPWIEKDKNTMAAYSRLVHKEWLINDKELSFAPVIYQEFHRRKRDFRVIYIGGKIFTVSCTQHKITEDIRLGRSTGEGFEVCSFNDNAALKLKTLMNTLSLDYCAADFFEDEYGKLYFLELNTCGAWWWVDRLFSGKICKAIVDYIEEKNSTYTNS